MTQPERAVPNGDTTDRANIAASSDEQRWVERVRAGDRAAFEAIYRSYYRPLVGFVCRYVHSEALAEEQVQELFLAIWRLREQWELRTTLRAYLYRGARNQALNHLKHVRVEERAARLAPLEDRSLGMAERRMPLDEALELDELAAAARQAVDRLPPRCRLTFTLRRDHGLSYAEIAQAMEVSEHTVKIQMTRALKAIRRALTPWMV